MNLTWNKDVGIKGEVDKSLGVDHTSSRVPDKHVLRRHIRVGRQMRQTTQTRQTTIWLCNRATTLLYAFPVEKVSPLF
jgi:hypothetical protein